MMANRVYDALIVGSGASGMFAAWELTRAGLSVLLLEAGPEIGPGDFNPAYAPRQSQINLWQRARATLTGKGVQARAAFFDGRMRHLFADDRKNPYTTPKDAPYLWIRSKQSGGRTHVFGRVLMRWSDDDFRVATRTGRGVDWPFAYADLVPFYEDVERLLGIHGIEDKVPTMPDSVYARPAGLTAAEEMFRARVEARWPNRRVTTWRYIGHDPSRMLPPLREARNNGLETRHNMMARRVLTDPSGRRATGVEAIDAQTGQVEQFQARSVVLCASPVESVRLLFNSASSQHPAGIGNAADLLGRYFLDQLPMVAAGAFPPATGTGTDPAAFSDPFYRPTGGIFLPRFIGPDGESAATNYAYQGSVGRDPVAPGKASRFSFFGYGMMQPDRDNRVTLDPRRRDAWGVAVPHIRLKMGAADVETLKAETAALVETIQVAGGELEYTGSPLGLAEYGRGAYPDADPVSRLAFRTLFAKTMVMGAAIHEAGGARMGTDGASSVLNPYNQLWDMPNLLVTDASAFPSGGVSGTTLTIMAMTVRACRNLAAELGRGAL